MNSFEYIRPEQLNNSRILSWFSYKNQSYQREGVAIQGLNIGLNTRESQEHILQNLHALVSDIDVNRKDLALAHQVHGTNVMHVTKGGFYEETDAFVTNTPGIALGIQVADCAAILLGDFEHKVIGAAHAGWRGAIKEIVPKVIQEMTKLGANPSTIEVFISPCLAQQNFEVGIEVANQFPQNLVDTITYPKPHVDLVGLVQKQLLETGIKSSHIEIDGRCTIDHSEEFYSYRRERDESGRMLAIIKLNKL